MKEIEARNFDTSVLAYLGDAVYEVYVRKHVIEKYKFRVNEQNKMGIKFVRAESQARAINKIAEILNENEKAVVRRAKNKKITSKPSNLDPKVYKHATSFEALIGYLHLLENYDREKEIIQKAIQIIEQIPNQKLKR